MNRIGEEDLEETIRNLNQLKQKLENLGVSL